MKPPQPSPLSHPSGIFRIVKHYPLVSRTILSIGARCFHARRKTSQLLATAGLAAALCEPPTLATAANFPSPAIPDGLGVNIHFVGAPAQDLDAIQTAGFRFVRMDVCWEKVEKQKAVYDFKPYDELSNGLAKRGIRALYILCYGNKLYEPDWSVRTQAGREAFARFAEAAARRYRSRGVIWELWNEPNYERFWQPASNASEYMALAKVVLPAIRRGDPNAMCLAPGLSGFSLDYLESCFKEGLLGLIDGVSVHPYRWLKAEPRPDAFPSAPELALGDPTASKDYKTLRALIAKYGPERPVICSEWGYASIPDNLGGYDAERQGRYLARMLLINLSEAIPLSIWYDWRDDGDDPKNNEHHFGTVTRDYKPKPAYKQMQRLVSALQGMHFEKRLPSGADDYLLLFADDEKRMLAAWTIGKTHDAEPISGLKLTLTNDPQYTPMPLAH